MSLVLCARSGLTYAFIAIKVKCPLFGDELGRTQDDYYVTHGLRSTLQVLLILPLLLTMFRAVAFMRVASD